MFSSKQLKNTRVNNLENFENECQQRMQDLIEIHKKQNEDLNSELEKDTEILK